MPAQSLRRLRLPLASVFLFFLAFPAMAAKTVELPDWLEGANFPTVLGRIIRTFLGVAGAIALAVFVYAGVRWMLSRGNEKSVQVAKDALKYAFFGILLIFFAYLITTYVFAVFTRSA